MQDIALLPAGPELEARILAAVCGWRWVRGPSGLHCLIAPDADAGNWKPAASGFWPAPAERAPWWYDSGLYGSTRMPRISTCLTDANVLIEAWKRGKNGVNLLSVENGWVCLLWRKGTEDEIEGEGETFWLAFARARLAAYELYNE